MLTWTGTTRHTSTIPYQHNPMANQVKTSFVRLPGDSQNVERKFAYVPKPYTNKCIIKAHVLTDGQITRRETVE